MLAKSLRSQENQAFKIVRFQRHLPLTIQVYISCRITGVPPLQSDSSGLSSALKDDTNEPKKRKEARTKPTKMARKKSTLRMTRTTTDKLPSKLKQKRIYFLTSIYDPHTARSRLPAIERLTRQKHSDYPRTSGF